MNRRRSTTVVALLVTCALAASCTSSSKGGQASNSSAAPGLGKTTATKSADVNAGGAVDIGVADRSLHIDAGGLSGSGRVSLEAVDVADLKDLPDGVSPVGNGTRVELSGATLTGTAQVTIPVPSDIDGVNFVPAVLWDNGHGGYEWRASTWKPGDTTITAVLDHFSGGFLGKIDIGAIAKQWGSNFANYFTGRFGVAQPSCGDEAAARTNGVAVKSDQGDTVKWCFGLDNGKRVVKVANNRRAYAEVSYPSTWTVADTGSLGLSLDGVKRAIATGAASLTAPPGTDVRLVAGGDTLTLDVPGGATGDVHVEMSVLGWLLSALEFGIDVWAAVAGLTGQDQVISKDAWTHFARGMAGIETIGPWGDAAVGCLRPLTDQLTDKPLTGAAVGPLTKFVWSCLPKIMKAFAHEGGGIGFVASLLLDAVATVVGLVFTAVNLIVTGLREIFDEIVSFDGKADPFYDIAIGVDLPDPNTVPVGDVPEVATPTVMLVVDTSGSMADPDSLGGVKIDGARNALLSFLSSVEPGTRLGLRSYPVPTGNSCNSGSLRIPVAARDPSSMDATIRTLTPDGDTPTAEALQAAADDLRAAGSPHGRIVLLSDGESTCANPCDIADKIRSSGIDLRVSTIALANSDQGRQQLQCIAQHTGGKYAEAGDTKQLSDLLQDLSKPTLDLKLDYPSQAVADVGGGTLGLVPITARLTNNSSLQANDVHVRLDVTTSGVSVPGPLRSVGNIESNSFATIEWDLRPSITLAGSTLNFTATVTGANLKSDTVQQGSVRIVDGSTRSQAGPLLANPQRVAILGDSYSAGEGAGDYLAGTDTDTNSCHRSASTYLVKSFNLDPTWDLACSGAVASDLTAPNSRGDRPQVAVLDDLDRQQPMDAIALTIGGNDMGFKTILLSCLFSTVSCTDRIFTHDTKRYLEARFAALAQTLWETYISIDAVLNRPDVTKRRGHDAPIFVLAYPRIIPTSGVCLDLPTLSADERELADQIVERLNGSIEAAVNVARRQGVPVYFVPEVENAFEGHSICSVSDSYVRAPHTIQLRPDLPDLGELLKSSLAGVLDAINAAKDVAGRRLQELFHPNQAGYEAMTRALVQWSLNQDETQPPPARPKKTGLQVDTSIRPGTVRGVVNADGAASTITLQAGATYQLQATGFAPGTPVDITLQSDTKTLAQVSSGADGSVHAMVTISSRIESGAHTFTIDGFAPDGTDRDVVVAARVPKGRALPLNLVAGVVLLLMLAIGLALVFSGRRRPAAQPARARPTPAEADDDTDVATAESSPAGWYQDPEQPEAWRYWDGDTWTDERTQEKPGT